MESGGERCTGRVRHGGDFVEENDMAAAKAVAKALQYTSDFVEEWGGGARGLPSNVFRFGLVSRRRLYNKPRQREAAGEEGGRGKPPVVH